MRMGDLTRFAGKAAQVVSEAVRKTGKHPEPWVELRVEGAPAGVWVPVWALPPKPSSKGGVWSDPTDYDGFSKTNLEPAPLTRHTSGQQLPPETETRLQVVPQREVVREAPKSTRKIPPGPFNEAIAALADAESLSTEEVAALLDEPLAAVKDMFEGGRPPFHPALCSGYRALAERLDIDFVELQSRALVKALKPKKARIGRIKHGRGKVHDDQTEMWIYRPPSEGR